MRGDMGIDRKAVDHVARLARLDLGADEKERMREELTDILEHAERIQALDLDGVGPTSHALPLRNVMRADEVKPSLSPKEALANAPAAEDDRFRVPRIIEEP
jgi:aspartyl-tRNA(Asn)/glutamyl-tRNA(Gln) amidotransferase subunit C